MSLIDSFDIYSGLVEAVDRIETVQDLDAFIRKVLEAYDLKHAVYYLPGLPGQDTVRPLTVTTYPQEWVHRYFEADYLNVDPCLPAGYTNLLPVDWASYNRRPPRVKQLFGESIDFGIGRQGLTIPIRGTKGEFALFNITSDLSDATWKDAKRSLIRDFQVLAHTIHAKAGVIAGGATPNYNTRITPRERECLTWCAVGKTSEDIATILGISEGVVRIHLQSAQHKLDCLNRTHTVAKAMVYKLIFPDLY
jgi:DNA-binding CsgD family transcriptional regulator